MPKIIAKENESFQVTLRRFKKACEKASLLSDVKKINFTKNQALFVVEKKMPPVEKFSSNFVKQQDLKKLFRVLSWN